MTVHYNPGDRMNQFRSGLNINYYGNGNGCKGPSTGEALGSIGLSIFGQTLDILGAAFLYNSVGGGGGGASSSSDSNSVASAQQKKAAAEIGIKTTQAEIDRLTNEEYISDDDYTKQKTDLEGQLTSLDTTFKMDQDAVKTKKIAYESAEKGYKDASAKYEQVLNIDSQISTFKGNAPIASCGKKIDPTKSGAEQFTLDDYNNMSDINAKKDALAKDIARADQVKNEYDMLINQKNTITGNRTTDGFKTAVVDAAKTTMDNAKNALNEAMGGTGDNKVEQYYAKRTDIQNQLNSLELKHKNSSTTLSAINTLKSQLSEYKTQLSTANEYLSKVQNADQDVASAKAAKKGADDGNFFSRLFNKKQRATRKYYNQQIAQAQQRRDNLN